MPEVHEPIPHYKGQEISPNSTYWSSEMKNEIYRQITLSEKQEKEGIPFKKFDDIANEFLKDL